MDKNKHLVGLSESEVLQSRQEHGANILTPVEKESLLSKFLDKFNDSLIRILLVAGVLSICISCYEYFSSTEKEIAVFFEPIGIFIAIFLATGLSFYFETLADREFALLNKVNDDEPVKVIRNGNTTEVPKKDIVVGDIVILATGDDIPADGTLLEATSLQVDESSLTGELLCAKTTVEADFDKEATFPSNHVLRGTKVMDGHGIMEVFAVGDHTENGKVFTAAQIDDSVKTPLNEQLEGLGNVITYISYAIAAAIIIGKLMVFFNWNLLSLILLAPVAVLFYLVCAKFKDFTTKQCTITIVSFFVVFMAMVVGLHYFVNPEGTLTSLLSYTMQTLMIAVTLIVVAVPEGLPMAVTLSLAYSMRRMLKTNNLVRKMHACETMGATTVICTDKTGTLTQNQMQVHQTNFVGLDNVQDETTQQSKQVLADNKQSILIQEGIAVNSTATLDLTDPAKPKVLGNPTEGALLLWLRAQGRDYIALKDATTVLEELPFSTERKFMATAVQSATKKNIVYVKGAPEIVLSYCTKFTDNVTKEDIEQQLKDYQKQAMRTLAFAYRELALGEKAIQENALAKGELTFLGIVAIADPVRPDVPPAVDECIQAGIAVKIVTGDTIVTAREIGRQIGIWKDTDTDKNIITGTEFAELSNDELDKRVNDLKIIARARPMDKKRLVESLQRNNQVVAVTGDGTNDAPALKAAHVGLSMGDGTSVAKEASDITIVDNSFSSIGRAVMWGRSLYQNIQRFILFQLTVNVTACVLVLVGAFMGTASPLTVTQMLWVNLIMDTFGAMALASLPPSESVMQSKPRDRNAFIINKSMGIDILGIGLFFSVLTLGFLYIFEHTSITCMLDFFKSATYNTATTPKEVTPYEQTLLFSIFIWTHFWYMFNARTFETNKSYFKLTQSLGFKTIVGVIIVGQIIIVELLYNFFNVEPMFHTRDWGFNLKGTIDVVVIFVLSSLVFWVREGYHHLMNKRATPAPATN